MKKLLLLFVLLFVSFSINLKAQDEDVLVKEIPVQFMQGSFNVPLILGDFIQDQDPTSAAMLNTYYLLSHVMLGVKFPEGLIEKTLTDVENVFGKESTMYGLAMIPKGVDDDENLEILHEASEIIKNAEGENSWEYAYALMHCANVSLNLKKHGTIEKSQKYINKCISILEDGKKDTWLYPIAMCNRGAAKLYAQDETFFDDMVNAYEILDKDESEGSLLPQIYCSILLSSTFTLLEMPDRAINLLETDEIILTEFELQESELYVSLCTTMCYAHYLQKDKKKAQNYLKKAEEACIKRFGADSQRYKDLDSYRKLF